MENNLIIERLKATIEKLKKLDPAKFYYGAYVTESTLHCGTVCCVAGWYPEWFPESSLRWQHTDRRFVQMGDSTQVCELLQKYHGLDHKFISALFYGAPLVFGAEGLQLPRIDVNANKETVLARFEKTLQFIESGGIELVKN
jgi:hypothetical protein